MRIAGRMAGEQLSAAAQSPSPPTQAPQQPRQTVLPPAQKAGKVTRGVARGMGGFLRPFTRVGGILWLEITGSFYLIIALVFVAALWKEHTDWMHGLNRTKLLAESAVMLVFLYLGVSAFWRASRK